MTLAAEPPARYANGRFGPGNPSRPLGSRNRASQRAIMSILDDFEVNRVHVLDKMRRHFTVE